MQTIMSQITTFQFEQHEGSDGSIKTLILDIPDINVGSDAQTMFDTIDEAIRKSNFI